MSDLVAWLTKILDEDEAEAGKDKYRDDAWWMEGPFDADHVLADIAAKRAIVAEHSDQHDCTDSRAWEFPYVGCSVIRYLGSIYAERSGYRDDWKV